MSWYFNPSVDLEKWVPVISTKVENADEADCGDIIAILDPDEPPSPEHIAMLIAAPDLIEAVEGLMEIAEIAMPDTYFATDSRVNKAREALAKAKTPWKEPLEKK